MRPKGIAIGTALAAALVLPAAVGAGTDAQRDSMASEQGVETSTLGAGLAVRESNGISYVSGGVGDEQQTALNQASKQFNLKLTLAGRGGHYLGGADIRIENAAGDTVLATTANGPMFLAKLPAGSYTVSATAEGKTQTRDVTISQSGQQELNLTWIEAADEPIRAGDAPEN